MIGTTREAHAHIINNLAKGDHAMQQQIIVGAGLAGLLCANMLRNRKPVIFEMQSELPNNHSAILRFRSPLVGDVLGIPFKKVNLIKSVIPWKNAVADSLAYSDKCGGVLRSDRSIIAGTVTADRYIAPPDLIQRMAEGLDIRYNTPVIFETTPKTPLISTIPLPALLDNFDHPFTNLKFKSTPGVNITATIDQCDAYVSLYIPNPELKISRISITGDQLIVEVPFKEQSSDRVLNKTELLCEAANLLGIEQNRLFNINATKQLYSKIQPIDNDARRAALHRLTDEKNIFSLGRFATWRAGLLLDDIVQDVRLIEKWITEGRYDMRKHR